MRDKHEEAQTRALGELLREERSSAHWRRHERQFAGGTFAAKVQRALQKLGCGMTTNKERS